MAYSFSQIQLYQLCPRRYRYEKVEKVMILPEQIKSNLYFPLGNTVHYALEMLYKAVQKNYIPTLERIYRHYEQHRQKELSTIRIKTKKQNLLDVFSQEDIDITYERGRAYIQRYYNTFVPFADLHCQGTEVTLWFEMQPGTKFQVKIDRIDVDNKELHIVDYKTNKALSDDTREQIKEQLTLYALAYQSNYPNVYRKTLGVIYYIHHKEIYTREIIEEDLEKIKSKYLAVIEQLEHDKFAYNFGVVDAFLPKKGTHCKQCPFEHICPLRSIKK